MFFGEPKSRIIFAADLNTLEKNIKVIDIVKDEIDVIKVASQLLYSEGGAKVIATLANKYGKPVFADLKVADVPHTSAGIVKVLKKNSAAAVMVHGFLGPDALEACIDAAEDKLGIIVQLELTSPGGKLFSAPIADDMARLASSMNIFGSQAPGNRPDRVRTIRSIIGPDPVIVCCGVGAQGGSYKEVLKSGGSYAIVGRAIYNAKDPLSAIYEIRKY